MEWSFHYEGSAAGLAQALSMHEALVSNEAKTQFKLACALMCAEADMCDARGKGVNVTANGSEGLEEAPERHLLIDVKAL